MGRYIEWDDVIDRYPVLNTIGGSDEVSSTYIVYAESTTEGLLASKYTVPFSNNNMTIKNLVIDYTYWMAARFKLDDAVAVYSSYHGIIRMLKKDQMEMILDDGTLLSGARKNSGLYSSTQSYHPAFGIDKPINWRVDSDQMSDTQDSRL